LLVAAGLRRWFLARHRHCADSVRPTTGRVRRTRPRVIRGPWAGRPCGSGASSGREPSTICAMTVPRGHPTP